MGIKDRVFGSVFPESFASLLIRRASPSTGVVLMYHEVLPDHVSLPAWTIVKESEFLWQMTYLKKHFDVIGVDEAIERVSGRMKSTRPFAVVTFDDGYSGTADCVLPIMEDLSIPFLVYVATKALVENSLYWPDRLINLLNLEEDFCVSYRAHGKAETFVIPYNETENARWVAMQRLLTRMKQIGCLERDEILADLISKWADVPSSISMLSPDKLYRLSSSKWASIGCHTHAHELLDQIPSEQIVATIREANATIQALSGEYPRHFAYPNGNFNGSVVDVVRSFGFASAMTADSGVWSERTSLFEIPRIGIGRFDSKHLFRAKLSLWSHPVTHAVFLNISMFCSAFCQTITGLHAVC